MTYPGTVAGPSYRPLPDIAEALGIIITKVHQLLRDRALIAVRVNGVMQVPAEFIADGEIVRGLPGTITLLTDAGYGDQEIIDWLFAVGSAQPSADTAMAALRAGRIRQVHRDAQVAGF